MVDLVCYNPTMTIQQAYDKYRVPVNLQLHQLRVAALAQIMMENWTGPSLDETTLVTAALFHDFAKLIGFDLGKRVNDETDAEIAELERDQKWLREKYGKNDHEVTVKICHELGVPQAVVDLLEKKNIRPWDVKIQTIFDSPSFELKILSNCDARISPNGLTTMDERFAEVLQRVDAQSTESTELLPWKIQELLQENIKIELDGIKPEEVDRRAEELRNWEI